MLQLEQPRDYVIYLPSLWKMDEASAQAWEARRQSPIEAEHAGEAETSLMLTIDPSLVRQEVLPPRQGHPQNRLQHLEEADLYTAIGWYASYPHHYAGEGEYGTAEKGEFLLNYMVNRLVEVMRVVKNDAITPALQAEFFESILR